ncbi:MAG: hypothetical protein P0Y59_23460 [Candidatus Sphingomonas phytovorans]|nr:hypothetical protein [Sphingomonas sp.]WEJ99820.1 MAG: hypothetical protein P0Y59_23460 [Sphingomonas sp.]
MSQPVILALILLALAPGASVDESRLDKVEVAQLTVHQRIIIRIPRLPFTSREPIQDQQSVRWSEKKGPKCVAMSDLVGAAISAPDSIDLMIEDGSRVRARLNDDCPPLDYYSGYYLKPTQDGMVCADRDAIRSRSGGSCRIKEFKRLVAKPGR